MPKVPDYTAIGNSQGTTALKNDDEFYVYGNGSSRKITAKELSQALSEKTLANAASVGVGYGKSDLYRGANLGSGSTFATASTAAQRAAIASGTFEGLFIGDYWTVNNVLYRIADFNYWKRSGDGDFNTNHIVLVPDASFGNDKMNDSNITTGAYVGSKMYSDSSSVLNAARSKIAADFGGYLATHKEYLENAVSDGAQTAGAWYNSTVELMNELMVYGCFVRCKDNGGVYLYTIDKAQLALFRLNPAMVNLRYNYWLRDVLSATHFAYVNGNGIASGNATSNSNGVRPAFPVKGTA